MEADEERLKTLFGELQGKSVDELIAQGTEKLRSIPAGAEVAATTGPAAGGAAPVAKDKKKATKVEKKAESESDDCDMGFGLD